MTENRTEDYKTRLKRARNRRNGRDPMRMFVIGACILIAVLAVILAVRLGSGATFRFGGEPKEAETETDAEQIAPIAETEPETEPTLSPEEEAARREQEAKQAVVDSYENLGIVEVSGYLNMRQQPSTNSKIIGKLLGGSACEIKEEPAEGWYLVKSGSITGYISSEFVVTGEQARTDAYDLVKEMAVVTGDKLNVRSEPSEDGQILEQIVENERYDILEELDGWLRISSGYISADYVDVRYALNEARKLDLRTMVLNMYDNLGMSNVNNYLNIRNKPSEDGKIIGKMTSKSGGEILEKTEDGEWYKIRSGPVTGYVKSDYILTGDAAKQEALQVAELMAIVSTDRLNARTEPNTDAAIWTQISNSERYAVLSQQDGWVEIELDSTSAFVSTDFVDVRYALNEAIQFTPIEERPQTGPSGGGGSSKPSGGGGGSKPHGGVSGAPGNAPASSKRTQIVNYAVQFLGNPYVYGGTSLTGGTDCSGFTMQVMAHFGVSLPHHSGSQANCGRAISASEMRPGDLVFYTNSSGAINHVALYIGNNQVCHASNRRDGIKISTWNYRTPARIVNVLGD